MGYNLIAMNRYEIMFIVPIYTIKKIFVLIFKLTIDVYFCTDSAKGYLTILTHKNQR